MAKSKSTTSKTAASETNANNAKNAKIETGSIVTAGSGDDEVQVVASTVDENVVTGPLVGGVGTAQVPVSEVTNVSPPTEESTTMAQSQLIQAAESDGKKTRRASSKNTTGAAKSRKKTRTTATKSTRSTAGRGGSKAKKVRATTKKAATNGTGRKTRAGGESQMDKARKLYASGKYAERKDLVKALQDKLGMTPAGASTYASNIIKAAGGSKTKRARS